MEFLIISGLSGAGKSQACDALEDLDFYCVDNMPVALIPRFAELCVATGGRYNRVALVADIRNVESFAELFSALDELSRLGCAYRILFIEAGASVIINRYKESRRPHPLSDEADTIEAAVTLEREILVPIRSRADYVIDTSDLTLARLKRSIAELFSAEEAMQGFDINVMSFGFKHGLPQEADLVFDVRFLPNPYYDLKLRHLSGLDAEVTEYMAAYPQTEEFTRRLEDMLLFLLPHYIEEGKSSLTIAVGCTGGRHRSVSIAKNLYETLVSHGYRCDVLHRDITRS